MALYILSTITFILVISTVAPLSRKENWWIRGFDFPRLQFATILLFLITAELLLLDFSQTESWIITAIAMVCTLYQAWWIMPYTRLFSKEVKENSNPESDNTIRVMVANVLESNTKYMLLLELVEDYNPDILATLETNYWWEEKLKSLEQEYQYTKKCPQENKYGMHVYSKLPLSDTKIQFLLEDNIPSIRTDVTLQSGVKVRVYIVHPAPPSPAENEESSERDAELIIVAKEASELDMPVIVMGDLNDVAWSFTTRLFRKISNLLDPRIGRGMFNTFHAGYTFIRWPLDHLFHSKHFLLSEIKRLPAFGSDHFPILVELVCKQEYSPGNNGLNSSQEDEEIADEKVKNGREKAEN